MFYYFGAKARLAKHYPAPQCETVIEPFAGSAGYSCHHQWKRTIIVERDARICDLWRKLMNMAPDEIRSIPCPKIGEQSSDMLVMLRAASEHSLTGRYITVTPRMVSRWSNLLERAATLQPVTREWTLIEGDYTDAPDIEATWFIDPPYANMTRGYAHKISDYASLAAWCQARRGQVIVCEQLGATWLPFHPLREIVTTNNTRKTEAWWTRDLLFLPNVPDQATARRKQ